MTQVIIQFKQMTQKDIIYLTLFSICWKFFKKIIDSLHKKFFAEQRKVDSAIQKM